MNLKELTPREYWLCLAADILACSNFSHVSFCVYLSLTLLKPNQLISSLPGMDYYTLSLFTKTLPDTLAVRTYRKQLTRGKKKKNRSLRSQSIICTASTGWCVLCLDRPYSCWMDLDSLSETMTLTSCLTLESSAWFTNG